MQILQRGIYRVPLNSGVFRSGETPHLRRRSCLGNLFVSFQVRLITVFLLPRRRRTSFLDRPRFSRWVWLLPAWCFSFPELLVRDSAAAVGEVVVVGGGNIQIRQQQMPIHKTADTVDISAPAPNVYAAAVACGGAVDTSSPTSTANAAPFSFSLACSFSSPSFSCCYCCCCCCCFCASTNRIEPAQSSTY